MSQDLLRRIMFPPMADEVLLHVKVVEQRGRDLVVYLAADVDGDPELPKNIQIPFSKYFNADLPLSELVRGGFGMLAEGPEPLILAYEEVMSKHGVSISHHQSAAPQNEVLSVLIFDKSYVIAERFSAEAA